MRILIILQVMKILTVMMMKTCSVMTKWSLYDCGMGLGQGLYTESVHNGARLIYALASTQSTCTHTFDTDFTFTQCIVQEETKCSPLFPDYHTYIHDLNLPRWTSTNPDHSRERS